MGYRVGIDVGGTFTDLVLVRPDGGLVMEKTPTTPRDQSEGVMDGLGKLATREGKELEIFLAETDLIVHGTTTADNTMIEMTGAVTGLLTTQGHRDEIELRRGYKEDIWDPALPPPPPVCPRRRRIGIPERLDYQGCVLIPLDEEAVRQAIRRLKKMGVEAIAVVFLFSFVNPVHERRVREIVAQEYPGVHLSLSHEVMPLAPEFERTSTTLVNAYVGPRIQAYLTCLEQKLRRSGFRYTLLLMQCNGGVMMPEYIARRAVSVISSGPTGGVMGACSMAGSSGIRDFLAVDMGGTSYDVCLVRDGRPEVKALWNWRHRYLIGLPMMDVYSIGAGGGSIASVEAGALKVGPRSAGAMPGPICYGRGATEPTVTDANLLLGYLNPEYFCGGEIRLTTESVGETIAQKIGRPLGLTPVEAAEAIFRVINANMANAIRRVSAHRGVDPRELVLVVYGGNGPVHAGMQAAELGITKILVPKAAPTFSALGLLLTDLLLDEVRSYITPVGQIELARMNALFTGMENQARNALAGGGTRHILLNRFVHMCYPGQTFDMAVGLDSKDGDVSRAGLEAAVEQFHQMHEELHTYAARDEEPILRGVRLQAVGVTEKPDLPSFSASRKPTRPLIKGKRKAYFLGHFVGTPVYDGTRLAPRHTIQGPAIIEEPFTTIVVFPGHRAVLDVQGNYHLTVRT